MNWALPGPPNPRVLWTLLLCIHCIGNKYSSSTEDITPWWTFLGCVQGPGLSPRTIERQEEGKKVEKENGGKEPTRSSRCEGRCSLQQRPDIFESRQNEEWSGPRIWLCVPSVHSLRDFHGLTILPCRFYVLVKGGSALQHYPNGLLRPHLS